MIDAPSYDYSDDSEENVTLTEGNAEQILDYINSMI